MNFCFVVNDEYVANLLVSLCSIVENSPGKHSIFILTAGFESSNRKKIEAYAESNDLMLDIICVDDSCLDDAPIKRSDFNKTPYYKLFIPDALPETIDKVLYLDVDIIVLKSLQELYDIRFDNEYFAAVPDPFINSMYPDYLDKLHIDPKKGGKYFNSGVMLFNLKELRNVYSVDKALEYIRSNGDDFKFHDQEVLNGLYHDRYIQLDERFNYIAAFRGIVDMITYCLGVKKNVIDTLSVIHYANATKPWNRDYIGKYREIFWQYAYKSPVYGEISINRKNNPGLQLKSLKDMILRRIKK